MRAGRTTILETTATAHHVEFQFVPEGGDWTYDRITVQVNPSRDGVLLHFSGLKDRRTTTQPSAGNEADIKFVVDANKGRNPPIKSNRKKHFQAL